MRKKHTPGRPPLRTRTQNVRLYVRAVDSEKELLEQAAEESQMTLSDWIRDRLIKVAKRELKDYG